MSRRRGGGGGSTGKMSVRVALVVGGAALACTMILVAIMMSSLAPPDPEIRQRGWVFGLSVAALFSAVIAGAAWQQAGAIGSRVVEISHAVTKLGRRGGSEARVRQTGNDELTTLARHVSHLSADLSALTSELDNAAEGGGGAPSLDPQVRALRDQTLNDELAQPDGLEVDGAVAAGDRGGLDWFGSIQKGGPGVVYVVSADGGGAMSVVAAKLARDELVRALNTGVPARKALAHTNRVMNKQLPKGACAKAALLEASDGSVKLYQAGYRTPLWICRAGEVLELNAEGLALGLDAGPVFEKGLRSETIEMATGVRLVQTNDAGVRSQELLDLVTEHSPKHTAPFMNLVLGGVEGDAGSDGLREDVLLLTVKKS